MKVQATGAGAIFGLILIVAAGAAIVMAGNAELAPGPSTSSRPGGSLPADVQAELDQLPKGTVIVPCSPSIAVLPEGVRPITPLGFAAAHPAFRFLLHGYCADDPHDQPFAAPVPTSAGDS